MRSILIGILLLIPFGAISQKYTSQDTAHINKLISDVQIISGTHRDSAIALMRTAYDLSVKKDYPAGKAEAGWWLGTYEMHQSRHDKATEYYNKSIELYKKLNRPDKILDMYVLHGVNEGIQNHSAKALGWLLQAVRLAEDIKDERSIADINYKIALVYGQVDDWQHAIEYAERSKAYAERAGDKRMLMIVYNNLGALYGQKGDYTKALEVLHKARSLVYDEVTARTLPDIYQNLGSAYREVNKFDLARIYLDSALTLRVEAGYQKGISGVCAGIADLLIREKKFEEALSYLNRSTEIATQAHDDVALYENYVLLHKIYTGLGKYKDAAILFDKILNLQEARENAEERVHVERTSMAMQLHEVEDEMKTLQIEKDAQTQQRNAFIGFSIITLAFVVFAVIGIVKIRTANQELLEQKAELAATNDTKDKMFAVISHDLRSPLNSIIGSLELLEHGRLSEDEQRHLVNSLHLSATATLETLDNLLQWGSGQFKRQETRQEAVDVNMLAEQTRKLLTNVASHKSVKLVQKIDDLCIARFDKSQLAFILRNLLVNAIKFSHEGQHVELLGRKEDGRIILQVKDYGVGMSDEVRSKLFNPKDRVIERGTAGERGVGLGLVLIHEFLEKNQGHISVTSEEGKGSCFEVNIPAV